MSYTIDLATGRSRHLRNPADFVLYVSLFPQLIAGPIVRFHEISEEITSRRSDWESFAYGAVRFLHGLAKKVVVADTVAEMVHVTFDADPSRLDGLAAWVGALAYTVQIYFDFSGYSDMAIGLGRMFGFRFPENFRRPYSAVSITDFWRRWHITLSTWFRDYVYIPLGGSRRGDVRTAFNLVLVFAVTGLWHGANWTFVAWGAYHGALLLLERVTDLRLLDRPPRCAWLHRLRTAVLVVIGWVMFRADSTDHAWQLYERMFAGPWSLSAFVTDAATPRVLIVLAAGLSTFLLPGRFEGLAWIDESPGRLGAALRVAYVVATGYAVVLVASGAFSPFLYFQF